MSAGSLFSGLGRGLTADIVGAPVDMAEVIANLGLAGGGYLGHKLGLLSTEQMPALLKGSVGGSDWFAKNTPLQDDGTAAYTAGRFTGNLSPLLVGMANKIPISRDSTLGANKIGWHGTTAGSFDSFLPNFRKNEQLGFGIHFADLADFAKQYAINPLVARKSKNLPVLYKTELTYQKPLQAAVLVKEGSKEFELAKRLAGNKFFTSLDENKVPTAFMQNAIDSTTPQRAERLIREAGYDAVMYNSRLGSLLPGGTGLSNVQKSPSTIVFTPEQIKILEKYLLKTD